MGKLRKCRWWVVTKRETIIIPKREDRPIIKLQKKSRRVDRRQSKATGLVDVGCAEEESVGSFAEGNNLLGWEEQRKGTIKAA